jgi:hypothetical protein
VFAEGGREVGTDYRWRCDGLREFFDPEELLGPDCEPGRGYGTRGGDVPRSAWVVACLLLDRWNGHSVRLVGCGSDDYDCDGFTEVSRYVLRYCLDVAPMEALRFLRREVSGSPRSDEYGFHPEGSPLRVERDILTLLLRAWADRDWPRLCTTPGCRRYGERHDDAHEVPPVVAAVREDADRPLHNWHVGTAVVAPGSVVERSVAPVPWDGEGLLRVREIVFAESMFGKFVLQRIIVRGGLPQQDLDVLAFDDAEVVRSLPVRLFLRRGQSLVIVARNITDIFQLFKVSLRGVVDPL